MVKKNSGKKGKMTPKEKEKFEQELKDECAALKSQTFLPAEYKKLRRQGYTPDEIHYDMCNIFR